MNRENANVTVAPLANARIAFIGCGVMAESIIAGLLRNELVDSVQIFGSHPRSARRNELYTKYGIQMFEDNREAALAAHPEAPQDGSMIILGVKPQRMGKVLEELKGA